MEGGCSLSFSVSCLDRRGHYNVPAADRLADDLYLGEVERCDVFIGLFGNEYGVADTGGLSPTHREFEQASRLNKHRLLFVKGNDDSRHPKMQELIRQAESQLVAVVLPVQPN